MNKLHDPVFNDGAAVITFSIQHPGVLAKRAAITPVRLILSLSAEGQVQIKDTIALSYDWAAPIDVSFDSLAAPLQWTLTAEVEDNNGRITNKGSVVFATVQGKCTTVSLDVAALFSTIKVLIPALEHAVSVIDFWAGDSLLARKSGQMPLDIGCDYLATGVSHAIRIVGYTICGTDTVACYEGSTNIAPEPGINQKVQMVLRYIGPENGCLDATIRIAVPGEIIVTAVTEPTAGSALRFSSSYLAVKPSVNSTFLQSISVAAWVKIPENPTGMGAIVSKWYDFSGAQRRSFALVILSDGSARFDVDASGTWGTGSYWSGVPDRAIVDVAPGNALLISKSKVALSEWTHIAGVFDAAAGTISLYVNGVLECSAVTEFTSIFASDEPIFIGAGDLGGNYRQYLNGDLDEVSLWSRPLSVEEVKRLALGDGLNGDESGLTAYWNFNQGSGSVVHDLSRNNNEAVLGDGAGNNMPTWLVR